MKEHLLHFFPFLKKQFRKIEKKELQSEETFKELFPDENKIDFSKIRTVYIYQNTNDLNTSYSAAPNRILEIEFKIDKDTVKTKSNAKV